MSNIDDKKLLITMPDSSEWEVDVDVVIGSHAEWFARYTGMSMASSLKETTELFQADEYECVDWARNNMEWSELNATLVDPARSTDYSQQWVLCEDVKVVKK